MYAPSPALLFAIVAGLLSVGVAFWLIWKVTRLALRLFLAAGLLLLLLGMAALVLLATRA